MAMDLQEAKWLELIELRNKLPQRQLRKSTNFAK
jgi:hypothetical protein